MRRSLAFAIVSMLVAGVVGCTDNDGTVFIRQNQVPGAGCTVGSGSGTFLAQGLIDTNSQLGYVFTPLIESIATSGSGDFAGGSDIVFLEGAEVTLSVADGNVDLGSAQTSFQVRFSASINPGGSTGVAFEIVPQEVLAAIAGSLSTPIDRVTVVADIEVFGRIDGSSVKADSFTYPVLVCEGCLINNLGSCELLEGTSFSEGGVCNPFQDKAVDCCDGAGGLVCPAVPEVVDPPV